MTLPSSVQYHGNLLQRQSMPFHGRLYVALQGLRGRPLGRYLRQLQEWEQLAPADFDRLHQQRLRRILEFAHQGVPLYRTGQWCSELTGRDVGQIQHWPLIDKNMLRLYFDDLQAQPPPRRVVIRRTSGSTGPRTRIVMTPESDTWGWAHRYRGLMWHGIPIGICTLRMSHDKRPLRDFVKGDKCVPSLESFEEIEKAVRFLIKKHPTLIAGPPSMLFHFARHLRARGVTGPFAPFARVGGEQLFEFQRTEIESVLAARAIDAYGSTETGALAGECPAGSLHVYADHVHLEIFQGDAPAKIGEFGDIVVTSLRNTAMPLVRYRVGDQGRLSPDRCKCGLPHPVLTNLQARLEDRFSTSDGRTHHGSELIGRLGSFFGDPIADDVRQIQFVQKGIDNWGVWIEVSDKLRAAENVERARKAMEDRLASLVRQTFGADCQVEAHLTDRIPREGGKLRYCRAGNHPVEVLSGGCKPEAANAQA